VNNKILQAAIRYLARREYSTKELQQRLHAKAYDADEITEVLAELRKNNYQNDGRFAEGVIRNRVNRGYGWHYIEQELKQKGISNDLISELRNNQQIDWYNIAELAYNKRFGDSAIVDIKDKAKRLRFLQARGFANDDIFTLLSD
jgi:regulatory protein